MEIPLSQQYNVGEKPTVILYTYYINRHAGTPENINNTPETIVEFASRPSEHPSFCLVSLHGDY